MVMTPDWITSNAPAQLYSKVGGFFTNTTRDRGHCQVCTGPATVELCPKCSAHQTEYASRLADLVVPLAYVKGHMKPIHQSEHHVFRYKSSRQPSLENRQDLQLMIHTASRLHGACIARVVGRWEALTFVPSASRPGICHPVVELAKQVVSSASNIKKILLDNGPDISTEPTRWPLTTRFEVADKWRKQVAGKHVLVVDDTWVSGGKSQSAAIALKDAGARAVTILCVARWLSQNYDEDHRRMIKELTDPYDATMCPVTGGACP
jgi:phosphoribosylpyrophosphate synthetase